MCGHKSWPAKELLTQSVGNDRDTSHSKIVHMYYTVGLQYLILEVNISMVLQ